MRQKVLLRIIIGITLFILVAMFFTKVVVQPWTGKKIQASLNEKSVEYLIKIEKVHISILHSGIELKILPCLPNRNM
jgi:hypothetical protein